MSDSKRNEENRHLKIADILKNMNTAQQIYEQTESHPLWKMGFKEGMKEGYEKGQKDADKRSKLIIENLVSLYQEIPIDPPQFQEDS